MSVLERIKLASGSTTIYVPGDYPTIQDALDNTGNGTTIEVAPGIYYEHVVIPYNQTSITLIGANPATTIIDGMGNGTVLRIESGNNTITGFTIRDGGNSHAAIAVERDTAADDYNTVVNNIFTTSLYGVCVGLSNYNTIANNTFFDNVLSGIYLSQTSNNNITENTISESAYGMRLSYSTDNSILGNLISETSYAIYISSSSASNTVSHNIVSGRTIAIFSNSDSTIVDHNIATESSFGIYFYNNKEGTIYYNILINNSYGIRLYMSSATTSNHDISNNKVFNNDWAIEMVYAYGNTFTGNWLQQNIYGAYLSFSASNTFYRNNFIDNPIQVYTINTNNWDYNGEGNYWSDYQGTDEDGNGIGDTPYSIIPGYDNFPLMETWSEHDILVTNVTTSTNKTYTGSIVNITATVKNKGKAEASENFNITLKTNELPIETKTVTNLAPEANQTLTFNWNTTEVTPGINYTISVEASPVPDELNTDNNKFIDGKVYVIRPLIGDINNDDTVNIDDLTLLTQEYGSTPTSPNWNQNADLNKDNIINLLDLFLLSKNYGKTI